MITEPVAETCIEHHFPKMSFEYTNHRSEVAVRKVVSPSIRWGNTFWHKDDQWLMTAFCLDRMEWRTFAMKDMRLIGGYWHEKQFHCNLIHHRTVCTSCSGANPRANRMSNYEKSIVKEVDVHHETDNAWQVSFIDGSFNNKKVWFPKSQCELYSRNLTDHLSIPEWPWQRKHEELWFITSAMKRQ